MIRRTLSFCFILLMWANSFASQKNAAPVSLYKMSAPHQEVFQKQDKTDQKRSDKQEKPDQPKIKEVPKAKRQVKPMPVKPNIKIKPIKIIKPKIKRP